MTSTHGNSTVNSSTTTINQTNINSNNGISTPSSDPTIQSRPQSISDRKTIDVSIEDGLHHPQDNKDGWGGSDPNSEEALSRSESMSDDDGVVMESGLRGYLVVFGGFLVSFL